MLSLANAEFLIGIISLIFAYLVSVTLIGVGQALVAGWAGDSTPEEAGFLSFNPLYYIDVFGFFCVLLLGFGWGKTLPFNPMHVDQPNRSWRVLLVYLTEPILALVLACGALVSNILILGPESLCIALQYTFFDSWTHRIPVYQLAAATQGTSHTALVLSILCIALLSINMFLAMWGFIYNGCYYALYVGAERGYAYMKHMNVILIIAPLVLIFTIAPYVMTFLLQLLTIIAFRLTGH
jgi:hypothetical protein